MFVRSILEVTESCSGLVLAMLEKGVDDLIVKALGTAVAQMQHTLGSDPVMDGHTTAD